MNNKLVAALLALGLAVAWSLAAREEAPIAPGTYLVYDMAGTQMRVTFSAADGDFYGTRLEYTDGQGPFGPVEPWSDQGDVVDTRLRTADGRIFELGTLGPLWVPPRELHEGGSAHGTRVNEVRRWESWEVGVVTASVGLGGALRGEWYYDASTGFLVGGTRRTAVSLSGEGQVFTLTDSNVPELGLR